LQPLTKNLENTLNKLAWILLEPPSHCYGLLRFPLIIL